MIYSPQIQKVGPVLDKGLPSLAVIAAIRSLNDNVEVIDKGSYLRVLVANRCHLTRAAVEAQLGCEFSFPGDLETIMPSFKGRFSVSSSDADWEVPQRKMEL